MDAETEVEATRVGRGVGVGGPRQIKVFFNQSIVPVLHFERLVE